MPSRLSSHRFYPLIAILVASGAATETIRAGLDDTTPYNSPEFYDQIRAKRKNIIAEQRATMDLSTHRRFRTVVTDQEHVVRVERLTYWFEVNKRNGVVDKVGAPQCRRR